MRKTNSICFLCLHIKHTHKTILSFSYKAENIFSLIFIFPFPLNTNQAWKISSQRNNVSQSCDANKERMVRDWWMLAINVTSRRKLIGEVQPPSGLLSLELPGRGRHSLRARGQHSKKSFWPSSHPWKPDSPRKSKLQWRAPPLGGKK